MGKTYRTLTLKTVHPQLHHPNIKYCLKTKPLEQKDGLRQWGEVEDFKSDTKLKARDKLIYCEQGLFYEVSFLETH
jgi:hypothetical protein